MVELYCGVAIGYNPVLTVEPNDASIRTPPPFSESLDACELSAAGAVLHAILPSVAAHVQIKESRGGCVGRVVE